MPTQKKETAEKPTEAVKTPAASQYPAPPHVFRALAHVRSVIDLSGIAKDDEAKDGVKFKFRGIDVVLDSFSGPMVLGDLLIVPSYSDLVVTQRKTASGNANFNSTVLGSYCAYSTLDGSSLQLGSFYGEANDTQDKSISKAQSIALRQFFLQTFVVPLGPQEDPERNPELAEYESVEREARMPPQEQPQSRTAPQRAEQVKGSFSPNQVKILNAKLAPLGFTVDTLPAAAGKDFNAIVDWIKAQ